MTFQIEDVWASPKTKFTVCYKKWCDIIDISTRNNIDTPDFFTWIKETFPEIIDIEETNVITTDDELYMNFKYTFESEAHYTWFLLQQ